jgi:hypothetical protein
MEVSSSSINVARVTVSATAQGLICAAPGVDGGGTKAVGAVVVSVAKMLYPTMKMWKETVRSLYNWHRAGKNEGDTGDSKIE